LCFEEAWKGVVATLMQARTQRHLTTVRGEQ